MHHAALNSVLYVIVTPPCVVACALIVRQWRRDNLRHKIMRGEHRLGVPPAQRSDLRYLEAPWKHRPNRRAR